MQHVSDRELAARCQRGDRAAQHEVYDRTSARIYRLLLRMVRNRERAADLTQDTYVRAFTRMHQFDGRAALATWLYRIAVNEALQDARREATRAAQGVPAHDVPVAQPTSPQLAARIDVEEALAALPPEDRAILLLRYQDGLDYAAVADITGCPPGTVASRLNRARAKLRGLLGTEYSAPEEPDAAVHPMNSGPVVDAGRHAPDRPGAGRSELVRP